MMLTSPLLRNDRRVGALALTLGMHLVIVYGWHLNSRIRDHEDSDAGSRIQWLLVPKAEPVAAPKPKPQVSKPVAAAPRPQASAAPVAPSDEAPSLPADVALQDAPTPAPVIGLLDRARSAVGEIDRGLQEANTSKLIRAKPVSTQMRLERAMQKAHDMAPNKWYEAPKVTEIIDPGGYGRRRYRVVGANGTYCITVESNHAPDGIDTMQHGIKPKLTNCDTDEQAATKQDW
ncbi:hypothetical protein [Massilia soli]|uniref:Type II secretion system protein GspG C-terminal domain-containing protein n=1 Tax=Massilia soli TaxID=2792854 RepID=A0ABS7SQU3_9BURK|nr:hypothetical protein [Massilia soli]MBZ2208309.1 hypothetical protein [Massilia soli]